MSRRGAAAVAAAALAAAAVLTPPLAAPPAADAVTQEQLLFLEAWRAVDRAFVDKKFNGQNWFKVRRRLGVCNAACGGPRPRAALHHSTALALLCPSSLRPEGGSCIEHSTHTSGGFPGWWATPQPRGRSNRGAASGPGDSPRQAPCSRPRTPITLTH